MFYDWSKGSTTEFNKPKPWGVEPRFLKPVNDTVELIFELPQSYFKRYLSSESSTAGRSGVQTFIVDTTIHMYLGSVPLYIEVRSQPSTKTHPQHAQTDSFKISISIDKEWEERKRESMSEKKSLLGLILVVYILCLRLLLLSQQPQEIPSCLQATPRYLISQSHGVNFHQLLAFCDQLFVSLTRWLKNFTASSE